MDNPYNTLFPDLANLNIPPAPRWRVRSLRYDDGVCVQFVLEYVNAPRRMDETDEGYRLRTHCHSRCYDMPTAETTDDARIAYLNLVADAIQEAQARHEWMVAREVTAAAHRVGIIPDQDYATVTAEAKAKGWDSDG